MQPKMTKSYGRETQENMGAILRIMNAQTARPKPPTNFDIELLPSLNILSGTMRSYELHTLDVFTDRRFAGNPLAVFPDAEGLSNDEMQQIAGELNLSETVFVLGSKVALRKLRIFTPTQELPLAGHPVVGTWNLLARLGVTPKTENGHIVIDQELKLGVLPVTLSFANGEIDNVEMKQGDFSIQSEITEPAELKKLAGAVGLTASDIGNSRTSRCQAVSTGIGSIALPVWSLAALEKISVDARSLAEIYLAHGAIGCYAFCFETKDPGSMIHARFFAPADGIAEDPATGSAAGALAGYLIHNGIVKEKNFIIEQGDFIGRPSRINARVEGAEGHVTAVRIGGKAVSVSTGTIHLD
jgi:trans-2,3-dihydro-3-hydroxyanthranilate isomerase